MWRRISLLYRRTPTVSTLETLPSEVGVMVGVVCIGQIRFRAVSDILAHVRALTAT
jgi:hypothetical protein